MLNKSKTISEMVAKDKAYLNPVYNIHFQKMKVGGCL